jgi:hypothetical protein
VCRSELFEFEKLRKLGAKVFQEEHQKYSKEDAEGSSSLETEQLKISGEIAFPERRRDPKLTGLTGGEI